MRQHDAAIAGGGPAGALAAILLARAGLCVALATLPVGVRRIEGLSPRVAALVARLGLPDAGVGAAVPRQSLWGERDGAFNREHPVDRAIFDAALLELAATEGVQVLRARVARLEPDRGVMETSAGPISARLLIEARGRRAPAARLDQQPRADRPGRCLHHAAVRFQARDPGAQHLHALRRRQFQKRGVEYCAVHRMLAVEGAVPLAPETLAGHRRANPGVGQPKPRNQRRDPW